MGVGDYRLVEYSEKECLAGVINCSPPIRDNVQADAALAVRSKVWPGPQRLSGRPGSVILGVDEESIQSSRVGHLLFLMAGLTK